MINEKKSEAKISWHCHFKDSMNITNNIFSLLPGIRIILDEKIEENNKTIFKKLNTKERVYFI